MVEIDKQNDFIYLELANDEEYGKSLTYYINLDFTGKGSVVTQSVEPDYSLVNAFCR